MSKLAEQIKQSADHAWESLSDGWRELSSRASGALTRFKPSPPPADAEGTASRDPLPRSSHWAFLAADLFESDDKLIVRIEAPGMKREDFNVAIDRDQLMVWGEKRIENESCDGRWRVVQSAYGNFRRYVTLPAAVQVDEVKASYRDGVLRVEMPKAEEARPRRIEVKTV